MEDDSINLGTDQLDLNELPEAGDRFELGKLLGSGISSNVYEAIDTESGKNDYFEIYININYHVGCYN